MTYCSANLTQAEHDWLQHMIRWGAEGYPVQRVGRKWHWVEAWGIKGAPCVYRTKRAAMAACAAYEDILIDKTAGRI